jgi:lysophospholipase L1-like esterase
MLKRINAAAAGAIAVALLAAVPAHGAQEYVALGDSYSSGTGTGSYYNEECQRSNRSFAQVVDAERPNTDLRLAACSGAETTDVLARQIDTLSGGTRWVTITIGGNDAGFARVVSACAKPKWAADCGKEITEARHYIKRRLPERLEAVYDAIERRAPHATTIVLSYPRMFKGEDCDAGTFFSRREMERLNETAGLLRDKTRRYALSTGPAFRFRDAIPRFEGHALCSRHEWLNNLTHPIRESFHPNRAGHRSGYAPLVRSVMD